MKIKQIGTTKEIVDTANKVISNPSADENYKKELANLLSDIEKSSDSPIFTLNRDRYLTRYHRFSKGAFGAIFRGKHLEVVNDENLPWDELEKHIRYWVLRKESSFDKIQKGLEALGRLAEAEVARRQEIPDAVKIFVWQRDEGKCAKCGSREKLEFDHVIPIAEGGSSTERNMQILCESCNRSKGKAVA